MRVSSNISGFYKYIMPVLSMAFVIFPIILLIILAINDDIGITEIILLPILSFVFLIIQYPFTRIFTKLVDVRYSKDLFTIESRNIGMKIIESSKVHNIERTLYYFYKIEVIENSVQSNYYFMPKILEVFANFWDDPESVKIVKAKIKSNHIEKSTGFISVIRDFFVDLANSIVSIFKKEN